MLVGTGRQSLFPRNYNFFTFANYQFLLSNFTKIISRLLLSSIYTINTFLNFWFLSTLPQDITKKLRAVGTARLSPMCVQNSIGIDSMDLMFISKYKFGKEFFVCERWRWIKVLYFCAPSGYSESPLGPWRDRCNRGEWTSKWTGRCRAFVGNVVRVVEVKVFVSTKATSDITPARATTQRSVNVCQLVLCCEIRSFRWHTCTLCRAGI